MPKEIVHWIVAEKTAAALGDGPMGKAASRYQEALNLGAVYPDIPYYLTAVSSLAQWGTQKGERYHGVRGEDTYDVIRCVLTCLCERDSPVLRAFLVGVVSHLQTDIVFHPMIFYFTGNTHDPDRFRRSRAIRDHRRIESILDQIFCRDINRNLRDYRAISLDKCQYFKELYGCMDRKDPNASSCFRAAVRRFIRVQGWYANPVLVRLPGRLDRFLPDSWQELSALLYRPMPGCCRPRLSEPLSYRNPVSGEAATTTLGELLGQAVARSRALCHRLESVLATGSPAGFPDPGPSLHFGIVGADASAFRYVAARCFRMSI